MRIVTILCLGLALSACSKSEEESPKALTQQEKEARQFEIASRATPEPGQSTNYDTMKAVCDTLPKSEQQDCRRNAQAVDHRESAIKNMVPPVK